MPLFTVTHRIAGGVRTNKVSVTATTPDEALQEIKSALSGDHAGVTPEMVEVINVVSADGDKAKPAKVEAKVDDKTEQTPPLEPVTPIPVPAPADGDKAKPAKTGK